VSEHTPARRHPLRTLIFSDVHLGTRACRIEAVHELLRRHNADRVLVVGDLIDLWRMRRSGLHFPQRHVDLLRTLLGKAKHGSEVIVIPGNHDDLLRGLLVDNSLQLGNIRILPEVEHIMRDGRRLLVVHGDLCDLYLRVLANRPLHWLLDRLYGLLTLASRLALPLTGAKRTLSQRLRTRIKRLHRYNERFERAMVDLARQRGYDGIICGHIHQPAIREHDGILYINCGDWVDHCTAVAEHHDGRLELLHIDDSARLERADGSRIVAGWAAAERAA
jgi:UDP-2,3-diacylglucosamine pyrophosphatase LpxH